MSILIGADIVPNKANVEAFKKGSPETIVCEDLLAILKFADYKIFNLETPLADSFSAISKCGPCLCAPTSSVRGLKNLGIDLLTLANNHIMDQSVSGLESTINTLKSHGIAYLGVGKNLKESANPYIFNYTSKKIGVYACVEHEFSTAQENAPGANPFDPLESFDHVYSLKKECDYVIVLYHGGKEHYRYPSPMLQKVCRKFVEKGADLVVCQHSHCIGCEEKYQKSTIVYGQGNFIFNTCDGPTEQTSLLIRLDDNFNVEYIPLEKYSCGVRLATGDVANRILSDFKKRSNQILQEGFVHTQYKKFAKERLNSYLLNFSGYNHRWFLKIINRLTGRRFANYYAKRYFKRNELLAIQNYVECEAHRELLLEGLKNLR